MNIHDLTQLLNALADGVLIIKTALPYIIRAYDMIRRAIAKSVEHR